MRIMALDVGEKRIDIALSDALGITAQPLMTYNRAKDNRKEDIQGLWELIKKHEVEKLVVGLPKNMNNTLGFKAEEVQNFIKALVAVEDIPVEWVDERLTTVSAERTLLEADVSRKKRKAVIDKMAAVLILQTYLESH